MKNFSKVMYSMALVFLFIQVGHSQIESNYIGEYAVLSGSPAETIKIYDNKVEAFINDALVEKFFFYSKENELYLLEMVKPDVEEIDITIQKDRKIMKVGLTTQADNSLKLSLFLPNGSNQEMILERK